MFGLNRVRGRARANVSTVASTAFGLVLCASGTAHGFGIHLPSIHVLGVTISANPIAPVQPTFVAKAEEKAANQVVEAAKPVVTTVAKAATETTKAAIQGQIAPYVAIYDVATGKPVGKAAQDAVAPQAKAIGALGEAASVTTAQVENLQVTVADDIAGDPGKTVMQLALGPERYEMQFASTLAIESSEVLQGANAKQLAAAPLAAAIRAAQLQYQDDAKPVPDAVKARLADFYTPEQLANARYAVGEISISIPDLINRGRKTFFHEENAVTVGNIMIFNSDPKDNYHWWAHELQHTVQYGAWGVDKFALQYITSCHDVEKDAEDHAQSAVPYEKPVQQVC